MAGRPLGMPCCNATRGPACAPPTRRLDRSCVLPTLAFLFVALFDVSGVLFGLVAMAKITENGREAELPGG